MKRRTFVTSSVGLGSALLAGCSSNAGDQSGGSDGSDGETSSDTATGSDGDTSGSGGRFRLLISDRPAAIGDFDSLTVSFSHARVFGGGDGEETAETETDEEEAEEGDEDEEGEEGDDGEDGDGQGGFTEFDLDGASVDLTQVVGDAAMSVLDEPLAPGRYTKIELHASDVVGIVEGEEANVQIPSEKLMLNSPFEVGDGETVSFVFDINVVQRGQGNDYNLLPVIGESGVAGRDVEVEEVEAEEGDDAEDEEEAGAESEEAEDEESDETEATDDEPEATAETEATDDES